MSKLLDRFRYFKQKGETFANGHGQVYNNNRDWEDSYRQRWQFDKIVRSTHGVNCTGSCSWKIFYLPRRLGRGCRISRRFWR